MKKKTTFDYFISLYKRMSKKVAKNLNTIDQMKQSKEEKIKELDDLKNKLVKLIEDEKKEL